MVWLGLSGSRQLQLQHHLPAVLGGGDGPHGQVPPCKFLLKGLDYGMKQEEGEAAAWLPLAADLGRRLADVVARVGR